jgi:phosphatidylserine decarboxylase
LLDDYLKIKMPEFNIANTLFVARPGLPFIFAGAALAVIFWAFEIGWARNVVLAALAFTVWFFRDPARPTPPGTFGLAPADGRVIRLDRKASCPVSGKPALKVSVFMNVFSVHVNRMPLDGAVELQDYRPGALVNASLDKASEKNERNVLVVSTPDGHVFEMVQIAGLVARRIVSWVKAGDEVRRGQRFGMIRFGSRVDLYLPRDAELMVALGQNVNAGWSPVWRWAGPAPSSGELPGKASPEKAAPVAAQPPRSAGSRPQGNAAPDAAAPDSLSLEKPEDCKDPGEAAARSEPSGPPRADGPPPSAPGTDGLPDGGGRDGG